jgi:hyperosmotically inducible protein
MRSFVSLVTLVVFFAVGILVGCSSAPPKSADVSDTIRRSLDQAGLHDVSVGQDRDKGVISLTGKVRSDADKSEAESIAKSNASGQVVSNEIAVTPPGFEREATTVNSDLDKGIEKNLDAALIRNRMNKDVRYDVKNGVVTLTGTIVSQSKREQAQKVAAGVPNVKQVINELEVKNQKATSTQTHQ